MADTFVGDGLIASSRSAFAVTKSDSTDYVTSGTVPKALYIGAGGDVAVQLVDQDGTTVTFSGVLAGTILPIRPRKIMAATTASAIIGMC